MKKSAVIGVGKGLTAKRVAAYLPRNYEVDETYTGRGIMVRGTDQQGWTLEGYVLPRLASGLMFGTIVGDDDLPIDP